MRSLGERRLCGNSLLELHRAFDSINHDLLLKKLSIYGLCRNDGFIITFCGRIT